MSDSLAGDGREDLLVVLPLSVLVVLGPLPDMASSPSCYLHLSFLFHTAGLLLQLVGYATPYWTVTSTFAGDVHRRGLVLSCSQTACQLLHLTQARDILVIVFCLSMAGVLLALLVAQLFCLSVCNSSCRSRNIGIGLSYLSFLTAVMVGVAQGLYEIDLKQEDNTDVTSAKMGWSRHLMIVSSASLTVSASLSAADFLARSSSRPWANRSAVSDVASTGLYGDTDGKLRQGTTLEVSAGRGRRLPQSADLATKMAAIRQCLVMSKGAATSGHRNVKSKTNILVVSQTPTTSTESPRDSRTRESNGGPEQGSRFTEPDDRKGLAIVASALQRYSKETAKNLDTGWPKQCLPKVEEERNSENRSKARQSSNLLTRQMALSCEGCHVWEACSVGEQGRAPNRKCPTAHARGRLHVKVAEPRDLSLGRGSECVETAETEGSFLTRNQADTTSKSQGHGRKNSAVEEALLGCNQILTRTVSGACFSGDATATGDRHSRLVRSASSGDSDCPLHDVTDCPLHDVTDCPLHDVTDCPLHDVTDCPPCGNRAVHHKRELREWGREQLMAGGDTRHYVTQLPARTEHSREDSQRNGRKHKSDQSSIGSGWLKLQQRMCEAETRRKMVRESLSRDLQRRKVLIAQ